MFQIFDILTGERIPKEEYDDMLRIEKVAKVVDIDENKKEIHKLSPRGYGFVKKTNIDQIEKLTADWKNHVFVDEYRNYGYLFALRFAIKGADDSLMLSVATKLHATVLKRSEEAVWFQTAIRGNTNTLSRFVDRFYEEKVNVSNIVILVFDDNRTAVKAYPSNLSDLFSNMSIIGLNGGKGLKTVSVDYDELTILDEIVQEEARASRQERNDRAHNDAENRNIANNKNERIKQTALKGINEEWISIRNRYPEESGKIFEYAQLLIDEINNCKNQFDKTAKKSINDEKYDDAHGYIDQSQFLQECLDTITDLFEA